MITADRLREVLYYDPDTGIFRWKVSTNNSVRAGDIAGSSSGRCYRQIKIGGRKYSVHRLAWLYQTGKWPEACIDHINGNSSDNRFVNLREATSSQNSHNYKKPKTNTSGFKGVSWNRRERRWQASIWVHRKQKHLGNFRTPEAAHAAYVAAAAKFHGAFARTE